MNKITFWLLTWCVSSGLASAQVAPTITDVTITPDTNAVTISYNPGNAGTFTVINATWTAPGIEVLTLSATHNIKPNSWVTVSGVSPNGYDVVPALKFGTCAVPAPYGGGTCGIVTSVTGNTITMIGPPTDPGPYIGGGTVTLWPFCTVEYGPTSGGPYLWQSETFNPSLLSPGTCSIPVRPLQDGGTYYFLPTARPDPDDDTDIGAGAEQEVCPTCASQLLTNHDPAPPAAVAAQLMCEPDVCSGTGYVTVPLDSTGPNGECVAQLPSVSAPPGYTGAITAGMTLTEILATIKWYGVIYTIPQGHNCIVASTYVPYGTGYNLPPLPVDPNAAGGSIDAANHRWNIFRCASNNAADFPPFGARTDPAVFSGHFCGFESVTPGAGGNSASGTIFEVPGGSWGLAVHHWWFDSNIEFSVDETQTAAIFGTLVRLGVGEGGNPGPYPEYIVFHANWFHAPARVLPANTPAIYAALTGTMAGQIAVVGSYFDNLYSVAYTLAQAIELEDCGGGGTCNSGGPFLIDNNYIHGDPMAIYVESNNQNNPTAPHDLTITRNALYWPLSTLSYAATYGCRAQTEFKDGQRVVYSGNFINGAWGCQNNPGLPFLILSSSVATDFKISNNVWTNTGALFAMSGAGGGGSGLIGESHVSSANRVRINNNLAYNLGLLGRNAGTGGASDAVLLNSGGMDNLNLSNNTVTQIMNEWGTYLPYILWYTGGAVGAQAGFGMTNNILPFGVSNGIGGSGIATQNQFTMPGTYSHPPTPQPNPANWSLGSLSNLNSAMGYTSTAPGAGLAGASVISGGALYPNNNTTWDCPGLAGCGTGIVLFGSQTSAGGSGSGCTVSPMATWNSIDGAITGYAGSWSGNAYPAISFTNYGSGCNPLSLPTITAYSPGVGSGASFRPAYGLTPTADWQGNVVVCTDYNGTDLTWGNCAWWSQTMPTTDFYPHQSTTLARQQAAGLLNIANNDFRVFPTATTSGYAGANMNSIESALGIVNNISTQVAATRFGITYTAPDDGPCYLDISMNAGATWTRASDLSAYPAGYPLSRSISVSGLPSSTDGQYRLLCHFDQSVAGSAGWFSFPSDPFLASNPNSLSTDGTFRTLGNATRNLSFDFSLSQFPEATSFNVTLTGAGGVQYFNTCTTSPCTVTGVSVGDYAAVKQWLAGSTPVASSDSEVVHLR